MTLLNHRAKYLGLALGVAGGSSVVQKLSSAHTTHTHTHTHTPDRMLYLAIKVVGENA